MKINQIIYVILSIVVLAGLFFVFKPEKQQETSSQPQATQSIQSESPAPESNVKTFELVIAGKKIVTGLETLKVTQGDEVTIKITADENEEFHVHAYDNSVELEKDKQAELSFVANLAGRFPFELEKSKTELGALEVVPKQ